MRSAGRADCAGSMLLYHLSGNDGEEFNSRIRFVFRTSKNIHTAASTTARITAVNTNHGHR
jgi:hypothetical protein